MSQDIVRLRDLGGTTTIPEWNYLTFESCPDCGQNPRTTCGLDEAFYDGEPVVCEDCGLCGSTYVDEDSAGVAWHGWLEGEPERLTDDALAGFRRLLGVVPYRAPRAAP